MSRSLPLQFLLHRLPALTGAVVAVEVVGMGVVVAEVGTAVAGAGTNTIATAADGDLASDLGLDSAPWVVRCWRPRDITGRPLSIMRRHPFITDRLRSIIPHRSITYPHPVIIRLPAFTEVGKGIVECAIRDEIDAVGAQNVATASMIVAARRAEFDFYLRGRALGSRLISTPRLRSCWRAALASTSEGRPVSVLAADTVAEQRLTPLTKKPAAVVIGKSIVRAQKPKPPR